MIADTVFMPFKLFSQCHLIGFITWPPFVLSCDAIKSGQVTKPKKLVTCRFGTSDYYTN